MRMHLVGWGNSPRPLYARQIRPTPPLRVDLRPAEPRVSFASQDDPVKGRKWEFRRRFGTQQLSQTSDG
jgi:hypothetical protein